VPATTPGLPYVGFQAPTATVPVGRPTGADAAERWYQACVARAPQSADTAEGWAAACR
jgi:hypothetical protein